MWANFIQTTKSHLTIKNEKDGDHPEDSYVSRVLREYYTEQQGRVPEWLEDSRKPKIVEPASVAAKVNLARQRTMRSPGPESAANAADTFNSSSPSSSGGMGPPSSTRSKPSLRDILHRDSLESMSSIGSGQNRSRGGLTPPPPMDNRLGPRNNSIATTSADRLRQKLRDQRNGAVPKYGSVSH
jgi:hypothetical protein